MTNRIARPLIALALFAALILPAAAQGRAIPAPMGIEFPIMGKTGAAIGTAKLVQGPQGVLITIDIGPGGMVPGWHGMHLHAVGDCSDTGEYKLSGSHVGMLKGGHGLLNPAGPEAGDLPSVYAAADGSVRAQVFTPLVTLAQGEERMLDDDGTALIFHENIDDQITQPIGGAGARIACAAIR